MKKKTILVLTNVLILTVLLTTPYFTPTATAPSPSPQGVYHWKIMLAQKWANAHIEGYLTYEQTKINGTDFVLDCTSDGFVFCKINTTVVPTDIHFFKWVDWNRDGTYDIVAEFVEGVVTEPSDPWEDWYQDEEFDNVPILKRCLEPQAFDPHFPICTLWEEIEPHYGYIQHLTSWEDNGNGILDFCDQIDMEGVDPPTPKNWYHVEGLDFDGVDWWLLLTRKAMVVVEVYEQPYNPDRPYFEWQLMIKQHGLTPVNWVGTLTKDGVPIGAFDILCTEDPGLMCQVITTPYCTVPNDIESVLTVEGTPVVYDDPDITQFPWRAVYVAGPGQNVTMELTEVHTHTYSVMSGLLNSAGYLKAADIPWDFAGAYKCQNGCACADGVPYCTREPYMYPRHSQQILTFTQRNPITGIVELGVLTEDYIGLDHTWYSGDLLMYFRSRITLDQQGCGWVFTGEGKWPEEWGGPVLGAVDYYTFNNFTGVYLFGADNPYDPQNNNPTDDILLAGRVGLGTPTNQSAGAGPPIGPCLQLLKGPDGILGTADDDMGRSDIMYGDGPDEPGSSYLFLPSTMTVTFYDAGAEEWKLLFSTPWPQLLTTGTAYDIVNDPQCPLDPRYTPNNRKDYMGDWHCNSTRTGKRYEFLAGTTAEGSVPHGHPYWNAYVTYVCVWSVLRTRGPPPLFDTDICFEVVERKVREDCVITDIDGDNDVNVMDILLPALAFGARDEAMDRPLADLNYDARGDMAYERGLIDVMDILQFGLEFGSKLTSAGIVRPF